MKARLLIEEKRGVIILPTAAIQRTSDYTHVFLMRPDSPVTIREIKVGASVELIQWLGGGWNATELPARGQVQSTRENTSCKRGRDNDVTGKNTGVSYLRVRTARRRALRLNNMRAGTAFAFSRDCGGAVPRLAPHIEHRLKEN